MGETAQIGGSEQAAEALAGPGPLRDAGSGAGAAVTPSATPPGRGGAASIAACIDCIVIQTALSSAVHRTLGPVVFSRAAAAATGGAASGSSASSQIYPSSRVRRLSRCAVLPSAALPCTAVAGAVASSSSLQICNSSSVYVSSAAVASTATVTMARAASRAASRSRSAASRSAFHANHCSRVTPRVCVPGMAVRDGARRLGPRGAAWLDIRLTGIKSRMRVLDTSQTSQISRITAIDRSEDSTLIA